MKVQKGIIQSVTGYEISSWMQSLHALDIHTQIEELTGDFREEPFKNVAQFTRELIITRDLTNGSENEEGWQHVN